MGIGGMVSGGIFAVLGVAIKQAGNAVPLSFLLAGILTLLTAYSYIKLTLYYGEKGGEFSFIEHAVENKHIASIFGALLVFEFLYIEREPIEEDVKEIEKEMSKDVEKLEEEGERTGGLI